MYKTRKINEMKNTQDPGYTGAKSLMTPFQASPVDMRYKVTKAFPNVLKLT
jgi:hypothetical protein